MRRAIRPRFASKFVLSLLSACSKIFLVMWGGTWSLSKIWTETHKALLQLFVGKCLNKNIKKAVNTRWNENNLLSMHVLASLTYMVALIPIFPEKKRHSWKYLLLLFNTDQVLNGQVMQWLQIASWQKQDLSQSLVPPWLSTATDIKQSIKQVSE